MIFGIKIKGIIVLGLGWIIFLAVLGYMMVSAPMSLLDMTKSQISFSAVELRSDFDRLEDLARYANYHYADFIFIVVYSTVLFFTTKSLPRLFENSRRFWNALALLFPAAGTFDFIENILMLRMLSESQTFPDWMAIVYSSFALTKLVLFFGGLIAGLLVFVFLRASKIMPQIKKKI